MKENEFPFDERQLEDGLNRLIEDLKKLNTSETEVTENDQNSLSLIVDEALKGVDIRKRYPTFYDHLLRSGALRSLFIECILDLKETPAFAELCSFPVTHADLGFLHKGSAAPQSAKTDWKVTLERTAEQLMPIFFAPQANTRGTLNTLEPFYTLLRSEFMLDQTTYSLIIEGAWHDRRDDALILFINLATSHGDFHPLHALLKWGDYTSEMTLNSEGRVRIEDLPFKAVFNENLEKIAANMQLTLTAAA